MLPDALDVTDVNRPVSRRSRWGDPVWRLDDNRLGAPSHGAALYWYDDIAPEITELFKKVIWSALVLPAGKAPKTSTLAYFQSGMTIVGRFMTEWDYADLSEFDVTAVEYLASHLRTLAHVVPADEDDEDAGLEHPLGARKWPQIQLPTPDGRGGGPISNSTCETAFKFIALVYQQRRVLRRMGVAIGDVDMLGGETPRAWGIKVREQRENKSEPVPEEIAMPLMIAADRLIGIPANDVLEMQDRYLAACARTGVKLQVHRLRLADLAVVGRPFSILPGEPISWHPELPLTDHKGVPETASFTVRDLVCMIRDIAVLTILQQTGMRIGEIVALQAGMNAATGLPDCIVRMRSPSGERDLFYAKSLVSKQRDVPDPELWLLGCVPTGSTAIPGPVRAIQILQRLLEPWRNLFEDPADRGALLLTMDGPGLPQLGIAVHAPTVYGISRTVSLTYARLMNWKALPDAARNGTDLTPYKRTRGSCIAARQWRKTFASNIARTDSRLLNSLRRHFKHMSLATTEGSYVGRDIGVLEDVDEAQLQMTMRFLRDQTRGGGATIGRTGTVVMRNIKRIREIDDRGAYKLGDSLTESLTTSETGLLALDHGSCAISISPDRARCHQVAGTVSFLNDRPNFEHQTPEMCAGCPCFVANRLNMPYWRTRFLDNNVAKRHHDRAGGNAAARVFEAKARRAWLVVRALRRHRNK